ncbi:MAG: galactokinase [Oscillospiraceae bacterium]|nr:galactokinase [Oscillospiraceae bacterium]
MNFDEKLIMLYGEDALDEQKKRYAEAEEKFVQLFGRHDNMRIFSAPGRTEVGGNHTDHNNGCVLAAAVDLDAIAFVIPTDDNIVEIKSEGFEIAPVDLNDLSVHESEFGTSEGLIRGVAAGLKNEGCNICGFKAYSTSSVLGGSGLSSSAAFEVLIGTVMSYLCNDGAISSVKIAQIAQYAENVYFGKPSGLMDQMASSVGGFITIDFKDTKNPVIDTVGFDFASNGYSLCIVDTKGSHADLTPDYAAIPEEMKSVARFFGAETLRSITKSQLIESIADVRKECGDRAVARAFHFLDESDRATAEFEALKNNDINKFFRLVNASGNSSYKYLQNIYPLKKPEEQALVLGLYTAETVLDGKGACRVHGGGFAGTIQAFVPADKIGQFTESMENVFGKGSCYKLYIRPVGGYCVR